MPRSGLHPASESTAPRLQKVLATAGYGSRRQCEQLILEGRVEIDRQVATELGSRVDLAHQELRVDGVVVKPPRHKYFALHKPTGVISTARDPWARTRVIDLIDSSQRVFTVGRLDKSSSGLILATNDGDLAHQLTHPRFGVEKLYKVVVAGKPTQETLQQLRKGVYLAEGKAHVERVTIKRATAKQSTLEMVLAEGRNREVRRLLARVGHKVMQLKRIAFGPVRLGELPVGAYRELTRKEVQELREAVQTPSQGKPPRGKGRAKASGGTTASSPGNGGRQRSGSAGAGRSSPSVSRSKSSGGKARNAEARKGVGRKAAARAPSKQGTVLGAEEAVPARPADGSDSRSDKKAGSAKATRKSKGARSSRGAHSSRGAKPTGKSRRSR